MHVPAEVSRGSFVNNGRDAREIGGDVVLEAVFANVVEQFLQSGNLDDACAAERFERIVGKSSAACITPNFTASIVGGKSREAHEAGFDAAHASAKRIFLAYRPGNDF